jgi:hypothetical protein
MSGMCCLRNNMCFPSTFRTAGALVSGLSGVLVPDFLIGPSVSP